MGVDDVEPARPRSRARRRRRPRTSRFATPAAAASARAAIERLLDGVDADDPPGRDGPREIERDRARAAADIEEVQSRARGGGAGRRRSSPRSASGASAARSRGGRACRSRRARSSTSVWQALRADDGRGPLEPGRHVRPVVRVLARPRSRRGNGDRRRPGARPRSARGGPRRAPDRRPAAVDRQASAHRARTVAASAVSATPARNEGWSSSGCPTPASPQSSSVAVVPSPRTLPGWKSPWTSVSGRPHASTAAVRAGRSATKPCEHVAVVAAQARAVALDHGRDRPRERRAAPVRQPEVEQLRGPGRPRRLEPHQPVHHREPLLEGRVIAVLAGDLVEQQPRTVPREQCRHRDRSAGQRLEQRPFVVEERRDDLEPRRAAGGREAPQAREVPGAVLPGGPGPGPAQTCEDRRPPRRGRRPGRPAWPTNAGAGPRPACRPTARAPRSAGRPRPPRPGRSPGRLAGAGARPRGAAGPRPRGRTARAPRPRPGRCPATRASPPRRPAAPRGRRRRARPGPA